MGRKFIRKPYLLQWRYRIDGDDVWMDTMNNTNHVIYLTLSTPTGSESVPSETVLNYACGWAKNKTTEDSVCEDILENGFKEHYTYNDDGPCAYFSSDFCRMVESLGIVCTLHRWAEAGIFNDEYVYKVQDMIVQKSEQISTVNFRTQVYTWGFHQWCEVGGEIRDPSTGETYSGDWGDHEDRVFDQYFKCIEPGINPGGVWENNQPGQRFGCEATSYRVYENPLPLRWTGPGVNPFEE